MSHEIELKGCSPTPLAHYLKALGILRLVAEQKDPNAKGCWRNEAFVLQSSLDKESLLRFFLEEYRPAPILTPWNGRGGFLEGGDEEKDGDDEGGGRKGAQMVALYTGDVHERFAGIKFALTQIATNKTLSELNRSRARFKVLDKLKKAKKALSDDETKEHKALELLIKTTKRDLLQSLRNELSGSILSWFDACQIVGEKLLHAPLLGTGGLDGSMDFGVNYLERLSQLAEVIETGKPKPWADSLLEQSLFQESTPFMPVWIPGQFAPGNIGAPNSSTGFAGDSRDNHWDYLFTLEGSILFATAATKRLQSSSDGALSYPFTVRAIGSGSGANMASDADPKKTRAEIWLPLWNKSSSLDELKVLFQEGRTTVGRRSAKDGLDFARAVASLGVDRGITEFQRYGFMMRSGKSYLATPINRIATRANPAVELIDDLERHRFLDSLRRFSRGDKSSARLAALAHQLESRLFDLTRGGDRRVCQDILILLGKIQRAVSISSKAKEEIHQPIPLLSSQWLIASDDASPEFRLACALASLKAVSGGSAKSAEHTESVVDASAAGLPMRLHFAAIKLDKKRYVWDNESRLAVWGEGSLTQNLNETLRCRWLAAQRLSHMDKPFAYGFGTNQADIAAFLAGSVDDRRISDLAQGLALLKEFNSTGIQTPTNRHAALPNAYALLKPFFVPDRVLVRIGFLAEDAQLPLRGEILSWLTANQTQKAVDWAWARLHQVGIGLPHFPQQAPRAVGIDGSRLLASLAFPLEFGQLKNLLLTLVANEVSTEKEAESSL